MMRTAAFITLALSLGGAALLLIIWLIGAIGGIGGALIHLALVLALLLAFAGGGVGAILLAVSKK